MREDMFKVIVERERHRSGESYHRVRRKAGRLRIVEVDGEIDSPDDRRRGPMRARELGYEHKQLNENLNPLENFLRSRCGRPWDKVYSEIREHLSPDNAVQQHVVQHLRQYVRTPSTPMTPGWRREETHEFYVDAHGILRQRRAKKSVKDSVLQTEIRLSPTTWLAMVQGIWYELEGRTLDDSAGKGKLVDAVFGDVQVSVFEWRKDRRVQVYPAVRWLRGNFVAASRRQLAKKELRARGLRNEP